MTDNIHQLHPNQDIVEGLRYLIEELEAGKLDRDGECTVVIGSEVFHFGNIHDDQAGANAIFQLTFGVAKLMQAALDDE